MRYVKLEEARPGMRLAYGLFDSLGRTLISEGTLLTSGYIQRLMNMDLTGYILQMNYPGIFI